jgi:hypothetical protein
LSQGAVSGDNNTVVRGGCSALLLAAAVLWPRPAGAAEPRSLYLNFSDGSETLAAATADDAASNRSMIGRDAPYPAFAWPSVTTGAITRAELVRRVVRGVHQAFLPYNVLVTTTRPAAGPYTMVLIGGGPRELGLDPTLGGVAFMDCEDRQPANVVFTFPENLGGNEQALIVTIAQEAGHSYGLEHTSLRRDIMHPVSDPAQVSFADEEATVLGDRLCGNVTQNSHRQLLAIVGPWLGDVKPIDEGSSADRVAPVLRLLEPAPGASVEQPLAVRVEAQDEGGIDHVALAAGELRGSLYRPPFAWSLAGLPAGPLVLTLTAYDASGNTTVTTATVTVGPPPAPLGCSLTPRVQGHGGGCALLFGLLFAAGGLRACARCRRTL